MCSFQPRHCSALADINQYDISDPAAPRHTGRIFTGGSIQAGSGVIVTEGEFKDAQPVVKPVKGVKIQGGPQMIQLRCAPMLTPREAMRFYYGLLAPSGAITALISLRGTLFIFWNLK